MSLFVKAHRLLSVRQRNFIKSKKGRLVPDKVLFPHPKGGWVDAWLDEKGFILRSEEEHIISLLKNGEIKSMIIPTAPDPKLEDKIVSRFLAKVAFECVPYYAFNGNQYDDDFIDQNNLHPLREYARFGIGEYWPYSQRRIYSEEDRFMNTDIQPTPYEIMHELDFLMIALDDIYFILVIMGIEYVINLNGPTIESYESWLKLNNHISPIRRGKEYMIERK